MDNTLPVAIRASRGKRNNVADSGITYRADRASCGTFQGGSVDQFVVTRPQIIVELFARGTGLGKGVLPTMARRLAAILAADVAGYSG